MFTLTNQIRPVSPSWGPKPLTECHQVSRVSGQRQCRWGSTLPVAPVSHLYRGVELVGCRDLVGTDFGDDGTRRVETLVTSKTLGHFQNSPPVTLFSEDKQRGPRRTSIVLPTSWPYPGVLSSFPFRPLPSPSRPLSPGTSTSPP